MTSGPRHVLPRKLQQALADMHFQHAFSTCILPTPIPNVHFQHARTMRFDVVLGGSPCSRAIIIDLGKRKHGLQNIWRQFRFNQKGDRNQNPCRALGCWKTWTLGPEPKRSDPSRLPFHVDQTGGSCSLNLRSGERLLFLSPSIAKW